MILSIIAAVAENQVIGKNNDLVWHMPADMKYFKETTTGHFVIMGRKTFESFGKPLKNRKHIIVTRNQNYEYLHPDVSIVHNLADAIKIAERDQQHETFVLGGAEIYRQSIGLVDRLYITEIKSSFDGDAYFPEIDKEKWNKVSQQEFLPDEKNKYPYAFVIYERKK